MNLLPLLAIAVGAAVMYAIKRRGPTDPHCCPWCNETEGTE